MCRTPVWYDFLSVCGSWLPCGLLLLLSENLSQNKSSEQSIKHPTDNPKSPPPQCVFFFIKFVTVCLCCRDKSWIEKLNFKLLSSRNCLSISLPMDFLRDFWYKYTNTWICFCFYLSVLKISLLKFVYFHQRYSWIFIGNKKL